MEGNLPYIVIAKSDPLWFSLVAEGMRNRTAVHLEHRDSPAEVLDLVRSGWADLVITGQVIGSGSEEIKDGATLSETIYSIDQNVLVFRHTLETGSRRGKIVGEVAREYGTRDTTRLIDHADLPRMLRERDFASFERKFPFIQFYSGWQQEH